MLISGVGAQFEQAVHLRVEREGYHLRLPGATVAWEEMWGQMQDALKGHHWDPGIPLYLWTADRVFELHHLQVLGSLLQRHRLTLVRIHTQSRSTAVVAAQLGYSVEQESPFVHRDPLRPAAPLYVQTTLRSGVEIRHCGSVVVWGDVNPGAEIAATGDVIVLGRLRGLAHAGCPTQQGSGDPKAVILALNLQCHQVRIADQVARLPQGSLEVPEIAYLERGEIVVVPAGEYVSISRESREG